MIVLIFLLSMCNSTGSKVESAKDKIDAVASTQSGIKESIDQQTRAIKEQTEAMNRLIRTMEERLPAR
ncbi:MAG: hypothetical protein NTX72_01455 [Candidatus Uhrbacteria bacterium]|nr:hypothetical protein [Candidatus Uhrbacteria bacterium]